jgi:hypothetical protein
MKGEVKQQYIDKKRQSKQMDIYFSIVSQIINIFEIVETPKIKTQPSNRQI